jgi:hypothetical protein
MGKAGMNKEQSDVEQPLNQAVEQAMMKKSGEVISLPCRLIILESALDFRSRLSALEYYKST